MKYALEIEVGWLWFSQLREVLKSYAWRDPSFQWTEGKGWLDRKFYIKGSYQDATILAKRFESWCGQVYPVRN